MVDTTLEDPRFCSAHRQFLGLAPQHNQEIQQPSGEQTQSHKGDDISVTKEGQIASQIATAHPSPQASIKRGAGVTARGKGWQGGLRGKISERIKDKSDNNERRASMRQQIRREQRRYDDSDDEDSDEQYESSRKYLKSSLRSSRKDSKPETVEKEVIVPKYRKENLQTVLKQQNICDSNAYLEYKKRRIGTKKSQMLENEKFAIELSCFDENEDDLAFCSSLFLANIPQNPELGQKIIENVPENKKACYEYIEQNAKRLLKLYELEQLRLIDEWYKKKTVYQRNGELLKYYAGAPSDTQAQTEHDAEDENADSKCSCMNCFEQTLPFCNYCGTHIGLQPGMKAISCCPQLTFDQTLCGFPLHMVTAPASHKKKIPTDQVDRRISLTSTDINYSDLHGSILSVNELGISIDEKHEVMGENVHLKETSAEKSQLYQASLSNSGNIAWDRSLETSQSIHGTGNSPPKSSSFKEPGNQQKLNEEIDADLMQLDSFDSKISNPTQANGENNKKQIEITKDPNPNVIASSQQQLPPTEQTPVAIPGSDQTLNSNYKTLSEVSSLHLNNDNSTIHESNRTIQNSRGEASNMLPPSSVSGTNQDLFAKSPTPLSIKQVKTAKPSFCPTHTVQSIEEYKKSISMNQDATSKYSKKEWQNIMYFYNTCGLYQETLIKMQALCIIGLNNIAVISFLQNLRTQRGPVSITLVDNHILHEDDEILLHPLLSSNQAPNSLIGRPVALVIAELLWKAQRGDYVNILNISRDNQPIYRIGGEPVRFSIYNHNPHNALIELETLLSDQDVIMTFNLPFHVSKKLSHFCERTGKPCVVSNVQSCFAAAYLSAPEKISFIAPTSPSMNGEKLFYSCFFSCIEKFDTFLNAIKIDNVSSPLLVILKAMQVLNENSSTITGNGIVEALNKYQGGEVDRDLIQRAKEIANGYDSCRKIDFSSTLNELLHIAKERLQNDSWISDFVVVSSLQSVHGETAAASVPVTHEGGDAPTHAANPTPAVSSHTLNPKHLIWKILDIFRDYFDIETNEIALLEGIFHHQSIIDFLEREIKDPTLKLALQLQMDFIFDRFNDSVYSFVNKSLKSYKTYFLRKPMIKHLLSILYTATYCKPWATLHSEVAKFDNEYDQEKYLSVLLGLMIHHEQTSKEKAEEIIQNVLAKHDPEQGGKSKEGLLRSQMEKILKKCDLKKKQDWLEHCIYWDRVGKHLSTTLYNYLHHGRSVSTKDALFECGCSSNK